MAKVRKNHYRVGQTICFIWSGVKKLGSIEERRPKNKKIFYNVRGEDGKLYENLYVDDSMIAAILSLETKIVEASFKKKLGKKAEILEVPEEFESLDDVTE
jgi:hypothetical protein